MVAETDGYIKNIMNTAQAQPCVICTTHRSSTKNCVTNTHLLYSRSCASPYSIYHAAAPPSPPKAAQPPPACGGLSPMQLLLVYRAKQCKSAVPMYIKRGTPQMKCPTKSRTAQASPGYQLSRRPSPILETCLPGQKAISLSTW